MVSKDLNTHMKCHSQLPKQFVCKNTLNGTHTSREDTKHLKIFKCPQCGKHVFGANALSEHMTTIHNCTQHQCHVCGKDYKTGPRLKVEIVYHSFESICNFRFLTINFFTEFCRSTWSSTPANICTNAIIARKCSNSIRGYADIIKQIIQLNTMPTRR